MYSSSSSKAKVTVTITRLTWLGSAGKLTGPKNTAQFKVTVKTTNVLSKLARNQPRTNNNGSQLTHPVELGNFCPVTSTELIATPESTL